MSKYYEINTNKHGLQAVTLQMDALSKIADYYNKKYHINIKLGSGDGDASYSLNMIFSEMKSNDVIGLVYADFEGGKATLNHVTPFILTKDEEGKESLIIFDGYHSYYEVNCTKKYIKNYRGLQADNSSCGMFSLHVLKHSLQDEKFIETLRGGEEEIYLSKMLLVQHSKDFEIMLSDKVRKVYVDETLQEKAFPNLKAFYKCHDALRKVLNEEEFAQYQAELNTRTKEVIAKIDEARQKHKAGSGPLELRRAVGMSSKKTNELQ